MGTSAFYQGGGSWIAVLQKIGEASALRAKLEASLAQPRAAKELHVLKKFSAPPPLAVYVVGVLALLLDPDLVPPTFQVPLRTGDQVLALPPSDRPSAA